MITRGKEGEVTSVVSHNHNLEVSHFDSELQMGKSYFNINMDREESFMEDGVIVTNGDVASFVGFDRESWQNYHELDECMQRCLMNQFIDSPQKQDDKDTDQE